jgi:hypothetical protein
MTGRQAPDPSKSSICPVVIAGVPTGELPVLHRGRLCPPGVMVGTTLPEFFADALPAIRGPSTASSSMRPGPRPTCSAPMAGDREDSACADKRRTGIGKRSHSLRPCGATGSTRFASLMDRSTEKASNSISSSSLCRDSSPATMSIMNNLGSHKGHTVRRTIRSVGARLLSCPLES